VCPVTAPPDLALGGGRGGGAATPDRPAAALARLNPVSRRATG